MTPRDLPLVVGSTQNSGGSGVETSSMKEKRLLTCYLLVVVVLSSEKTGVMQSAKHGRGDTLILDG